MKRIILILALVLCAIGVNAQSQFPSANNRPVTNAQEKITKLFWLATSDTIDYPASNYPGAISYRSDDSSLYVSDGHGWHPIASGLTAVLQPLYIKNDTAIGLDTSRAAANVATQYYADSTARKTVHDSLANVASVNLGNSNLVQSDPERLYEIHDPGELSFVTPGGQVILEVALNSQFGQQQVILGGDTYFPQHAAPPNDTLAVGVGEEGKLVTFARSSGGSGSDTITEVHAPLLKSISGNKQIITADTSAGSTHIATQNFVTQAIADIPAGTDSSIAVDETMTKSVSDTTITLGVNDDIIVDTVANIDQLESFTRNNKLVYVTDSLRGGLFYKASGPLVPDSGIVFNPPAGGYWVRQYDDPINIAWYGARSDSSSTFNRLVLDKIIAKHGRHKIIIPQGISVDYSKQITGNEIPQTARISDYNRNIEITNATATGGSLVGNEPGSQGAHVFMIRGLAPGNRGSLYVMPNVTDSASNTVSKIDLFLDDYARNNSLYRTAGFYSYKGLGTYKQGIYAFNSKVLGNYWFANPEWWQTMRDLTSVSMKWMNYSTDIPDSVQPILPWQPAFKFDSGDYVGSLVGGTGRIYQCIQSGYSGSIPLSGTGSGITDSLAIFNYLLTPNSQHFYNQTQVSSGDTSLGAIKIPNLALVLNGNTGVLWGKNISFLNELNKDDSVSIARIASDLYLYSTGRSSNLRINKSFIQANNADMMIRTSANNGNALQVGGNAWMSGTVQAAQYKLSDLNTAPASATDTGVKGEIRITTDYIYVCVATNTWVRAALSTW